MSLFVNVNVQLPVFWACGVTPQNVILESK